MPTRINGDAVRRIREEQGLSIPDVAGRSGLDRTFIYRIERGIRYGGAGTRLKLAQALGVKLDDITCQVDSLRTETQAA